MIEISIIDWKPGLNTIALIGYLIETCSFGLIEAKKAVENLISAEKQSILISVSDAEVQSVISVLEGHGLVYQIENRSNWLHHFLR